MGYVYSIYLKRLLVFFLLISGLVLISQAQTPPYFKGLGTGTNTIPMNTAGSHCQQIYLPTDFNTVPISGNITKIYFRNSVAGASGVYSNFEVNFLQNTLTAFPNTTFLTGFTQALSSASINIAGNSVAGGWYEIPLATPFLYDNSLTLICEIKYTARTGGMSGYTTTAVGNKRLSIITAPGPLTGNLSTLWGDFGIEVVPATACTSPPAPGTATTSATGVCTGASVTLNLTGNSTGLGQTYQWLSGPTAGGPFTTNVGSSQSTASLTITASSTLWYRAAVTCSGNTQFSVPVQVVVNPAFPGGTYTINSAVATGGTNYQTFADAISALSCGIGGPVIFNVNATSGPYNEQVIIPVIGGTSAINTITFNGNGRAISDNGNAITGQRAVFKLDGADYITINNFLINTGAGTYGFGVQLLNDADNNTISNCIINTNNSSTSTTNYAGIVVNSIATAITTAGASLCDNNTISGNTITGGLAGVAIVGNTTTSQVFGNKILNNTITDFYNYGVYINGNVGTLIEGNDISRPLRSVLTTFYGVFFTTISTNTIVTKNKFHDPFAGNLASTAAAYGVDHVNCDATAGNENEVSNNLVYNFFGGTGTQNGFLSNGSDFIKYYHNTIALEDVGASCATCGTRGFYQQGTATGLTYKNNIVTIRRGGAGDKQGIYFEQATLTGITLSNNDYYFYSGLSGLQKIGHIGLTGGTGYTTIAAWQTGTSQEAGSVSIDPIYLNIALNDYHPTSSALNNLGTPVGILTDITGAARSLTTPDMGAYEFNVGAGLDMGATNLVNPVVKTCYSNAEAITVRIRNYSASTINLVTNPVTVTLNVTGAVTVTLTQVVNTGSLAAGATMDVNFTGTLNMSAAGTYTFNANTLVTGDVNAGNNAMPPESRTVIAIAPGTISSTPGSYCLTGGIPTLTLSGNAGGNIQWQENIVSATGPWNNVGTNSTTYTPSTAITATTYYRAVISCNANSANSNVVTVSINNPQVLTTTPGSSCGPGPVTLGATTNAGSTLRWFQNSTGGTVLGTGPTFTTPVIATTTTYYVSASAGGGGSASTGLPAMLAGTSGFGTTNFGLVFDALSAFTLSTVTIYPIAAASNTPGTVTIDVIDPSGAIVHTATVSVLGNPTTAPVPQTVSLNFNIAPGTNYKLRPGSRSASITALLFEPSATAPPGGNYGYPFVVPGTVSINHSTLTAAPGNTPRLDLYYYFYNWTIGTGCESARTPVVAIVNPAPSATISYTGSPFCSGGGTISVVFNGTTGGTFSASPAGLSLNSATGAVNLSTSAAGTYTVTYNIPALGGCPTFTATTSITVTASPSATISYTGSPYCNIGTAAVTRTGTAGGTYSSSAGLSINATTGDVNLTTSTAGTYTVTYFVAATGGCPSFTTTGTITINTNSTAPTAASASNTSLCGGGTTNLTVTGGSLAPGASWVWYRGGCGGASIGSGATLNNVSVTTTSTFYVRAEGICNNTTCANVTVSVFNRPVVELTPSPNTNPLTPYIHTNLKATVSPPGIYTYSWFKNSLPISFTGSDLFVDVDGLGSYYVIVTDVNGCTAQSPTVTITARASTTLFIYPNPNNGQFQVRYFETNPSSNVARTLTIYDSKGAKVFENAYSGTAPYLGMKIDLRRNGKGVYHVKLSDAAGNKVASGRVIIY